MRSLFTILGLLLAGWSVYMVASAQEPGPPNKTVITWATDDTPIRRQQIDLFNRLNPDLHLKLDPTNRDPNKVVVQSLGGVGPDAFDVPATSLPVFVRSGIARDVTEDFRKIGIDPSRDFWKSSKPMYELNGKVYGVPANVDTLALLYNQDLFDAAGVPYPSAKPTWDEVVKLAQRLTIRDGKAIPKQFGLMFWWNWRDFFAMENAHVFSEDGQQITLETEAAARAIRRMHDLIYVDRVSPSPTEQNAMATQGGWGGGNESKFVAGKAAMILGPRYFTAHFRRAKGMRVGVAPLPCAPGGSGRTIGRLVAVNSKSPRVREALRFLAYVAGPDYNRLNNAEADGLGAVVKYTYEPGYLFDPRFPNERSNAAWRDAMLRARSDDTSSYITNDKIDEALGFHLDLVSQGRKTAKEALRDAQRDAERSREAFLRENAALRAQFEQAMGAAR